MGRSRPQNVIAGAGIMIAMFYFVYQYHPTFNIDATVANNLFTLLPALIVTVICIYVVFESRGVGRFGGCLSVGIALCYLLFQLNALALLTPDLMHNLTVPQAQTIIIVASVIVGAVMYSNS